MCSDEESNSSWTSITNKYNKCSEINKIYNLYLGGGGGEIVEKKKSHVILRRKVRNHDIRVL